MSESCAGCTQQNECYAQPNSIIPGCRPWCWSPADWWLEDNNDTTRTDEEIRAICKDFEKGVGIKHIAPLKQHGLAANARIRELEGDIKAWENGMDILKNEIAVRDRALNSMYDHHYAMLNCEPNHWIEQARAELEAEK